MKSPTHKKAAHKSTPWEKRSNRLFHRLHHHFSSNMQARVDPGTRVATAASSAVKNNAVFRNTAEYMNLERPQNLLLLAWNYFGKIHATAAEIESITDQGCNMFIYTEAEKEHVFLPFSKDDVPITDVTKLASILSKLFNKYSNACRPQYALGSFFVLLWAFLLLAVASEADVLRYPFLQLIRPYALACIRPTIALWALIFLILSHTVEGLYVVYLFYLANIPKHAMVSWVSMTFIFGWPYTSKAMLLAKLAQEVKQRKQQK